MSLINDALKRASTTKAGPISAEAAAGGPPLEPVADAPSGARFGAVPLVLSIVGIGSLLVAGALWLKAKGTPAEKQVAAASHTVSREQTSFAPAVQTPAVVDSKPAVAQAPSHAPNPIERAAATFETIQQQNQQGEAEADKMVAAQPVPAPTTPVPQTETVVAEPKPVLRTEHAAVRKVERAPEQPAAESEPVYKLQAIYYRLKGPTVVINGKTLKTGQIVDGARVIAIQRNSVEIERFGVKQTLTVP